MFIDKRLVALSQCCSKDPSRTELQNVHIKDGIAEATDGVIWAHAKIAVTDEAQETIPDYPDVESRIPKDRAEIMVRIAAEYLEKLAVLARAGTDEPHHGVTLYFDADPESAKYGKIRFKIRNGEEITISGILMPLSPIE